ncbi:MAG: inositol monophosphatase family protein [Balneolaceae bacterium]
MNRDYEVALKAAREGAKIVKSYNNGDLKISYKGVNDLVTDADKATEKAIRNVINENFPEDAFMGEESAENLQVPSGRVWIVDPIDGTTNFAYGFPVYCVSVALWIDRQPEAGVVIEINLNEEFSAYRGGGAWLNGKRINVSSLEKPEAALVGTGFPYRDYNLMDHYMNLMRNLLDKVQGLRRPGAAAFDLCCVAAGRFQGYYEYGLSPWDVAAAGLIIQEAGGVISNWRGGEDWISGDQIVAGNGAIHRFLMSEIAAFIPEA